MSDQQVDLLPITEQAIERYGYVKRDAARWLAERLVDAANKSGGATVRAASSDFRSYMTEAGLIDPGNRFDILCGYVIRRARSLMQRERALRMSGHLFAGALFSIRESWPCCEEARAFNGKVLPDYPVLPLANCSLEECFCAWRQITVREARKLA